MKRPERKRTAGGSKRISSRVFSADELEILARNVRYVGSPEHKHGVSFAGQPRPRGDASLCDKSLHQKQPLVQEWLEEAIKRGHFSELFENGFPRYVWSLAEEGCHEARLTNAGKGEYKGYPIEKIECPLCHH